MKEISATKIATTIADLCMQAAYQLGDDVIGALHKAFEVEESPVGREVLSMILRNAEIAAEGRYPLCQDTGFPVIFARLGQDVAITGGIFEAAINEGVRQGYQEGYLRKSIVRRPFSARINTGDNTPAVIHTQIVPGDQLRLVVMPKGGGSENMSYLHVFPPAAGREGVLDYVVDCVVRSGANPCPPVIVGVGIGGTVDKTMLLAKEALLRWVGEPHSDPEVARLERDLGQAINDLGIGPQGLGGRITALAVHVETFPAHIASMPVAVTLQCHSARHKEAVL